MSSLALVSMMVLAFSVGVVWVSLTRIACNFQKGKTLLVSHALYNSKYRKLIISLSWVTAILFALSLDKFHWDTVLIAISFFCFGLSYVIRNCWGHFLVISICVLLLVINTFIFIEKYEALKVLVVFFLVVHFTGLMVRDFSKILPTSKGITCKYDQHCDYNSYSGISLYVTLIISVFINRLGRLEEAKKNCS